jgi:hypothetical protein
LRGQLFHVVSLLFLDDILGGGWGDRWHIAFSHKVKCRSCVRSSLRSAPPDGRLFQG